MARPIFLALILAFALSPAAEGQNGDPDCMLYLPGRVSIGGAYDLCIVAPPDALILLLVSDHAGPIQGPCGVLEIGIPTNIIPISSQGQFCLPKHRVPCDPGLIGLVGFFEFIAFSPTGACCNSNMQVMVVGDAGLCNEESNYETYSQGGWGTSCQDAPPGCVRDEFFPTVFPNGLKVGVSPIDGGDVTYTLLLTSSAAVEAFLPEGGPSGPLTGDEVDQASSSAGSLAGQLVAATINVAFDAAGILGNGGDNGVDLADLVFVDCAHAELIGSSVTELLQLSNAVISGSIPPPGSLTYSDLTTALEAINLNFHGGTVNNGCLGPPLP
jgi:hypothetical protein